jgi:ribosomal protein L7Ae-like RNA K-turn-binding protein
MTRWKESLQVQKTTDKALSQLLGFIGLCRRAGKTVLGTPMVCEELAKKKKPDLVLYSEGASDATKKRIRSKCSFYGVDALPLPVPTGELAHLLGKHGDLAALAVTDAGFANAIRDKIAALAATTNSTGKESSQKEAPENKI